MALNSLNCAAVPLRVYSFTHSLCTDYPLTNKINRSIKKVDPLNAPPQSNHRGRRRTMLMKRVKLVTLQALIALSTQFSLTRTPEDLFTLRGHVTGTGQPVIISVSPCNTYRLTDVPMSRGDAVSLGRSYYITSFTLSCLTRGRTQAGSRYSMNLFILITSAKGGNVLPGTLGELTALPPIP